VGQLLAESFAYFQTEARRSPIGLVPDSTAVDSPCSIAAVGMSGVTAHVVATCRGTHLARDRESARSSSRCDSSSEAPQVARARRERLRGFF
jgi:hypothetical protein